MCLAVFKGLPAGVAPLQGPKDAGENKMLTAIFDGNCLICQSTRRTIEAMDWLDRITFIDLHDRQRVPAYSGDLSKERLMGEIHVIDREGRVVSGFYATRRLLREVPLGLPIWLLLGIPGMDALGIRVYRLVARHRYRINRLLGRPLPDCCDGSCQLPS